MCYQLVQKVNNQIYNYSLFSVLSLNFYIKTYYALFYCNFIVKIVYYCTNR